MSHPTLEKTKTGVTVPNEAQHKSCAAKQNISGFKLAILLASLTLVFFLVLLDNSIIGTAIPQITTEFHSIPDIGWYIGAYTFTAATLQPLSGKIYAELDPKKVYLVFLFFFELGSLISGVAPSSLCFILGRAIAGIGVSGIANGSLTILSTSLAPEKLSLYLGFMMGIGNMGTAFGPLIGGALTQNASWRWCFYINLPSGCVTAAIVTFMKLPETPAKEKFSLELIRKTIPKLDLAGFALFVPLCLMFLLALQFGSGNTHAWDSATVIGLFCGSGVMAIIFVCWEHHKGDSAMVPGSLLKKRIVWTSCAFGTCLIICQIVAGNWLPTYFQAVRGEDPMTSGVHLLPSILGQLLFVVVSGALISKLGFYLPWAFTGAIFMAVGNGLVSTFSPTTSTGRWIGYQIIMGAGRGASFQTGIIAVQNAVPRASFSVAIAMLMLFQNLGASIGVVVSNTIFAQTITQKVTQYAPSISAQAALHAGSGASAVRALVIGHEGELYGVLRAYSESLRNVFYLLIALSCLAMIVSTGMGWVDVRKDTKVGTEVAEGRQQHKA